ncbi:rhodanese-like domain-containing protein [Algoriphagus jejuensis]
MKNLLILSIVALTVFSSCAGKQTEAESTETLGEAASPINLDPAKFQEMSGEGIILDVRTPEEIASGKIEGALEMDFRQADFASQIANLPKDKAIFVYCAVGARSKSAAELLIQDGFSQVYHLSGGTQAWTQSGLPLVQE